MGLTGDGAHKKRPVYGRPFFYRVVSLHLCRRKAIRRTHYLKVGNRLLASESPVKQAFPIRQGPISLVMGIGSSK